LTGDEMVREPDRFDEFDWEKMFCKETEGTVGINLEGSRLVVKQAQAV